MFNTKAKEAPNASRTAAKVDAKINELENALAREARPAPKKDADVGRTVIAAGTVVQGNVTADGDLQVDGIVKGDVATKTTLVVGGKAVIEGNISSQHADIAGKVTGTVKTSGLVTIRSTSGIVGDVITRDLNVEPGSSFQGRFQVGASTPAS
jgi:cytoskeletal protein CcmA (bactofilin family)